MGNANSNVSDGVKKQADAGGQKLYQLVDLKGSGLLVELTKQATTTKNYAALDEAIKTKLEPFLYNNGQGKLFHVSRLVIMRNKERPKHKHIFKNEEDFDNYKEPDPEECKDPSMYRDVCWDLNLRGAVGESCLHLCLLNATSVHAELGKRLIRFYPKLINDVYMSDDYYGENVLHMAIVNEDPAMVKFLLDSGVNVQERCTGSFMSPEDQKTSRSDCLDHEWANRDPNTNYEGYVYWGEYPACFAACLGQEECYRLILARGADPNSQDTNGNTVLHLLVIHDKVNMFNMAYELGADSGILNNLNLTPLTLAAKMAKKELFFHIMNIEREIYWQIGSVTCAAYPLTQLDTIDTTSGQIQKESALNLIVFGETTMHLELMEGPVIDLLHAKWNAFVKFRFYRQFIMFAIYFLISITAFVSRPIYKMGGGGGGGSGSGGVNGSQLVNGSTTLQANQSLLIIPGGINTNFTSMMMMMTINVTDIGLEEGGGNFSLNLNSTAFTIVDWRNGTAGDLLNGNKSGSGLAGGTWSNMSTLLNQAMLIGQCPTELASVNYWFRVPCEILMLLGSIMYLLGAARECNFLGASMFFENLATAPSRVTFLCSCILVNVMAVLRFTCQTEIEDLVAVIVMLLTAPFFLFFCRGFKTVGPFVVMIYRMLAGDLLRFVVIYLVFVMGFSQAFYIIFLSYKPSETPGEPNPMATPAESVINMFMMSLSSFDATFAAFKDTEHEINGKLLFVVYMAIVAILLINMLIAMMGNTYTKIAETKNEWQRQWARIVLVVERGVSPKERYRNQGLYSQPMSDGTRALVLRLNQSEEEKEEMKELMDIRRLHTKNINRRKNKLLNAPRMSIANTLGLDPNVGPV